MAASPTHLFAGRGLGGVVADEGVLVEHGLVAAQEGVVVGLLELADLVSDGQTHVEDPAAGADVGVVAVLGREATLAIGQWIQPLGAGYNGYSMLAGDDGQDFLWR